MKHTGTIKQANTYRTYIRFKQLFLLLMVAIVAVVALVAIGCGSSGLTISQVVQTLLGRGDKQSSVIVWNLRLPRTVTAIVGGIGLASVGCVMQSILRNPLASSSTLGVSQGAAFGAAFAIIALGAGLAIWGVINLLEGYGNDNPGAKSQGMKQLMAGAGVAIVGMVLVPLLSGLFTV